MSKMEELLDYILATSEKGEASLILQFRDQPQPAVGALRRHAVQGIFEMLVINQPSPNAKPFPLMIMFTAEEVQRVLMVREDLAPRIMPAPQSGLVIPT